MACKFVAVALTLACAACATAQAQTQEERGRALLEKALADKPAIVTVAFYNNVIEAMKEVELKPDRYCAIWIGRRDTLKVQVAEPQDRTKPVCAGYNTVWQVWLGDQPDLKTLRPAPVSNEAPAVEIRPVDRPAATRP